MPWGSVGEVVPYLLRRATENADAMSGGAHMGRQDALSKPQKLKVLRWCVFRLHQGFQVNQIFIYINSKNMT